MISEANVNNTKTSLTNQLRLALKKNLPKVLQPALSIVPFSWQKSGVLSVLNALFKDDLQEGDLDFLQGSWCRISINDLNLHWLISVDNKTFVMTSAQKNSTADVSFNANGDDLLLIAARKEDPDTLFFQRRLIIEGNTELGLGIKNLIDAIDTDELPPLFNKAIQHTANLIQT